MEEIKTEEHTHMSNEKKTLIVIICTIIAMIVQITYGHLTKSMALLAEGYHMGTHVLTLGLTYIAYILARKLKDSEKFPSGTYKIGTLAAYTSSILLGFAGFWITVESFERFFKPESIQFNEAILIAVICLVVNTICITVMKDHHFHIHPHTHHIHKGAEKEDYNYKAAYYHILADILSSVLTIIVLVIGKMYNCIHLDAVAGIICGLFVLRWAFILLKHTVKILVDMKDEN